MKFFDCFEKNQLNRVLAGARLRGGYCLFIFGRDSACDVRGELL